MQDSPCRMFFVFQFTPLREGRREVPGDHPRAISAFQFTPLREGRRAANKRACIQRRISIHAPPRGATCEAAPQHRYLFLFQFTPLREGRHAK